MTECDVAALARRAYPRNRVQQLHFIEGFMAEAGDAASARGLVGSKAEKAGQQACQIVRHKQARGDSK